MNKKNINELKCEFDKIQTPDVKIVKSNINFNNINQPYKHKLKFKFAYSSFACILIFPLILLFFITIFNTTQIDDNYLLYIDVNPSIELTINKDDIVVSERALNKDAVLVLLAESYIGDNIIDATNNIVYTINELGYLQNNNIHITTVMNNSLNEKTKDVKLKESLDKFLLSENINSNIITINHDELLELANKYKVSTAKMKLILECNDKTNKDIEELLQFTIQQLKELLVEYDKDYINSTIVKFDEAKDELNKLSLEISDLAILIKKLEEIQQLLITNNYKEKELLLKLNDINNQLLDNMLVFEGDIQNLKIDIIKIIKNKTTLLKEKRTCLLQIKLNYKNIL